MKFHLVSAQFCVHYFLESEKTLNNFLSNVSSRLMEGGQFVFTVPDYQRVLGLLLYDKESQESEDQVYWENEYFSLLMPKEELGKQEPHGIGYGFFLADYLIGNLQVKNGQTFKNYVKEYLLVLDYFKEQALNYDLEIVSHQTFDEYFKENFFDEGSSSFNTTKCNLDQNGYYFNQELWECVRVYKTFIV